MKDTTLAAEAIVERSQDYIENRLEYAKLKTTEKAAEMAGSMICAIVLLFIGLVCLFFMSGATAIYLGKKISSKAEGFFIVGSVYGILVTIAYILKKKLITLPVTRLLFNRMVK